MEILYNRTKEALANARKTFGDTNQILVAVEELCELACVLTKYPRYHTDGKAVTDLRERVLEECGDVLNALDHVQAIFNITDEDIIKAAAEKGDRVNMWLSKDNSGSMEITTVEREIPKDPCAVCQYLGHGILEYPCCACEDFSAFMPYTNESI